MGFMVNQLLGGGRWEEEAVHLFCTPFLYVPGIKIAPQYRRRGIATQASCVFGRDLCVPLV